METQTTKYFDNIINKTSAFFVNIKYIIDKTPQRSIIRMTASYKDYRIFITELLCDEYRKYNFYLLKGNYVKVGFDNAPDIRAIKLKFNKIPNNDIDKLVPHVHLKNKTILELTDEKTIDDFIDWISLNIPK